MDKLKSLFGGKHDNSSAAPSNTASQATTSPPSSGNGANAEGVTLHTTLGDITIALFKDQTPKVSFKALAPTPVPLVNPLPDLRELRDSCRDRQIRQRDLPPYHQGLHDPGR
jgi:hypothetical protein